MVDGLPAGIDGGDAPGYNLVVETNAADLGKVLHPISLGIVADRCRVIGEVILPEVGAAEGRHGECVPVKAVRHLMRQNAERDFVLEDNIASADGKSVGAITETRSGDEMAAKATHVSAAGDI